MLKNWIFLLLLFPILLISKNIFAQTEAPLSNEEITKLVNPDQKKWRNLFVNFGGEFLEKQSINSVLAAQEIPVVPANLFYAGVGFSYRNQEFKDTFEAELGFNFARSEEDEFSFGNTYNEVQLQFRYERKFAEIQSAFFSAGVQTKLLFAGMDIYPDDSTTDLDELTDSQNNLSLQHQAFFLGPSFSFNWINPNTERLVLRIILNYDFNLFTNRWEARYGNAINSFKENGSRYSLRMLIPLYF